MMYDLKGFVLPLPVVRERGEVCDYDSLDVLRSCFENYTLDEWDIFLREMTEVCLTTDNTEFAEPEQRANLLQQGRELRALLTAAWRLADMHGTGKKPPNP